MRTIFNFSEVFDQLLCSVSFSGHIYPAIRMIGCNIYVPQKTVDLYIYLDRPIRERDQAEAYLMTDDFDATYCWQLEDMKYHWLYTTLPCSQIEPLDGILYLRKGEELPIKRSFIKPILDYFRKKEGKISRDEIGLAVIWATMIGRIYPAIREIQYKSDLEQRSQQLRIYVDRPTTGEDDDTAQAILDEVSSYFPGFFQQQSYECVFSKKKRIQDLGPYDFTVYIRKERDLHRVM